MKIVIIGDGKVGYKLTRQLSAEDYDVVLIDNNEEKLRDAMNRMDIICVHGEGGNVEVQKSAGVPEADQGKIFQRFYRSPDARDADGVGIGLYLVRKIAEGQGGYVKVFSKPGEGAKFSLCLPGG